MADMLSNHMHIHKMPLVLDNSDYKKKFTQIVVTYQARTILDDINHKERYHQILKKNAQLKGEVVPEFSSEEESSSSE